jgi:hypothetical protein
MTAVILPADSVRRRGSQAWRPVLTAHAATSAAPLLNAGRCGAATPVGPGATGYPWHRRRPTCRPDRLAAPVLRALSQCLLTRLSEPEAVQAVGPIFDFEAQPPGSIPRGDVWHSDYGLVRLRATARRVAHIRHRYKYLVQPLPRHKRFYFRNEQGFIGLEPASLFEFLQILPPLPIPSLVYHHFRGDFAAWAQGALEDGILGAHMQKLVHRPLEAETLREALLQRVMDHYAELYAMR